MEYDSQMYDVQMINYGIKIFVLNISMVVEVVTGWAVCCSKLNDTASLCFMCCPISLICLHIFGALLSLSQEMGHSLALMCFC